MQRLFIFATGSLLVLLSAIVVSAFPPSAKGLVGAWEGSMHSGHGDQNVRAVFKQENNAYSGTMTGMDGKEQPLKNIKVEGEVVTAAAELETPNGKIKMSYILTLKGDKLEGVIMGDTGHNFEIDIKLKRVAEK